jgi:enoyl-CoA hydratase
MNYMNLSAEVKEDIVVLTINRPDKLNALNGETLAELKSFFLQVKDDPDVSVVIVTGAGEKAFIAGADIVELSKQDGLSGKEFSARGQEVFNLIENLGKPVIAAINGFALGGGCELALACHIRIASEHAKIGQPEVNLGIIPGYGGTQRLAKLVGTGKANELILTGDMIDAEEAKQMGLVNQVYQHDEFLAKAWEMAEKISKKGSIAVKLAIEAINRSNELSMNEGQAFEAALFGLCCSSEDFKEGTTAFLEKRKPNFKNK